MRKNYSIRLYMFVVLAIFGFCSNGYTQSTATLSSQWHPVDIREGYYDERYSVFIGTGSDSFSYEQFVNESPRSLPDDILQVLQSAIVGTADQGSLRQRIESVIVEMRKPDYGFGSLLEDKYQEVLLRAVDIVEDMFIKGDIFVCNAVIADEDNYGVAKGNLKALVISEELIRDIKDVRYLQYLLMKLSFDAYYKALADRDDNYDSYEDFDSLFAGCIFDEGMFDCFFNSYVECFVYGNLPKKTYSFHEGNASMFEILGKKGANLAEMTMLGLPVPPGFTISRGSVDYFKKYEKFPVGLKREIKSSVKTIESEYKIMTGVSKKYGGSEYPLLLSVRSGGVKSRPGEFKTITKVGLCRSTVDGYGRQIGNMVQAYYEYYRYMQDYAYDVLNNEALYNALYAIFMESDEMATFFDEAEKRDCSVMNIVVERVSFSTMKTVVEEAEKVVGNVTGKSFHSPIDQLYMSIQTVIKSYGINDKGAVNIQAYVNGNIDDGESCSGVVFSRNPITGRNRVYGKIQINAEGSDVVTPFGDSLNRKEDIWRSLLPLDWLQSNLKSIYDELEETARFLELHFKEVQDIEITVEKGRLFLLQTRGNEKSLSSMAKFVVLTDLANGGVISENEAFQRISKYALEQFVAYLESARIRKEYENNALVQGGVPILPGIATGAITVDYIFDSSKEKIYVNKQGGTTGESMFDHEQYLNTVKNAVGVLTVYGSDVDHVAVAARETERMFPRVAAGRDNMHYERKSIKTETLWTREYEIVIGGKKFFEGDVITIDGNTGSVYEGVVPEAQFEDSEVVKVQKGVMDEAQSYWYPYYKKAKEWIQLIESDMTPSSNEDPEVRKEKVATLQAVLSGLAMHKEMEATANCLEAA